MSRPFEDKVRRVWGTHPAARGRDQTSWWSQEQRAVIMSAPTSVTPVLLLLTT